MKLLLISDSHGLENELIDLFESHKDYVIIHCGDFCIDDDILERYNVIYVKGNCDISNVDLDKVIEIDSKKIFITHGHKYNVKSSFTNIYYKALENQCDYVFFGHTHRHLDVIEDGIHFINPGSLRDSGEYVEIIDDNVYLKRM